MVSTALRYTLMRLALFVAAAAVLYAVGARGFLLLVLAVLLSGIVSFFLLSGPRDAMSQRLAGRLSSLNRRIDDSARAEDDERPTERDQTRAGDPGAEGHRNV